MQLTVKVVNGAVRQSIRNVARAIPHVHMRRMWRLMQNAVTRRKEYPPEPPNSTYTRTGAFGASVEAEKIGPMGVRMTIGVDYASYVGGDAYGMGQASIHEGRWELTRDIVQAEVTDQISDVVEADLERVARQEGMGL